MASRLIISADSYKEKISGYDPAVSDVVHFDSVTLADEAFDAAVSSNKYSCVTFLCGGAASGKTEFINTHLATNEGIIFDSTLSSNNAAGTKLKKAKKYKLARTVILILPLNLQQAYLSFLNRDRKFPVDRFIATHLGCRQVVLHLLSNRKYDDISIQLYISAINDDILTFTSVAVSRENLKSILESEQFVDRQEIEKLII